MDNHFKQHFLFRFFASLKLTTVCLFLLFLLTFWGTLYQADAGIYEAQHKYFFSFFLMIEGLVPFVGGQTVMWVLFINLLLGGFLRFQYTWQRSGILMLHIGILSFFISGFFLLNFSEESYLKLLEGQGSNISKDYRQYELAVWTESGDEKAIEAYDLPFNRYHRQLEFQSFRMDIQEAYRNTNAFTKHPKVIDERPINSQNIVYIEEAPRAKDPEIDVPGVILQLENQMGEKSERVLLHGSDPFAAIVPLGNKSYFVHLRPKSYVLPVFVKLLDFRRQMHRGTEIAAKYESTIEVETPSGKRPVEIKMNKPFRYKEYTFYQASYEIDSVGRESSTFAVVKNSFRLLPYFATFLTFFGMVLHFTMVFIAFIRKRKKKVS